VIFCARRVLKLTPSWPVPLQEITGFQSNTSFMNPNALLWAMYELNLPQEDTEILQPNKKLKASYSPGTLPLIITIHLLIYLS